MEGDKGGESHEVGRAAQNSARESNKSEGRESK